MRRNMQFTAHITVEEAKKIIAEYFSKDTGLNIKPDQVMLLQNDGAPEDDAAIVSVDIKA